MTRRASDFGKQLRKLRLENDENQKDMANKLGVSVSFISFLETGSKQVPLSFLEKLTSVYGVGEEEGFRLACAAGAQAMQFVFNPQTTEQRIFLSALQFHFNTLTEQQFLTMKNQLRGHS
ncbi:helix-turn-helix domain-containing protein [Saccharibacter sp. EH60]|uniref:helix-turn-helix domain-containing protein n=1 Tax=Saccharibacter sp. EH60 TaxID=2689390 RepID=UPI00135E11E5|nr:helix-turn-helix transcriptional regulator [Saccharibacter sp. EH60]MXV66434.1 helix-turn-helix domain-containing protein [Saccharibacter sp. EH60]